MPLIVPYLYPAEVEVSVETKKKTRKNDLKEWLLVNAKGLRARHSISEYHAM